MKSSRVHRESSSFICVHRSTAGAFGAAAATCGRSGDRTASATAAGAAGGGTLFGEGAGTEALRAGFAGNGLISTGDGAAATRVAIFPRTKVQGHRAAVAFAAA